MKKHIFVLSILLIASILFGCSSASSRADVFNEYQSDFELIKDLMLNEGFPDSDYKTYGIVYDDNGVIVDIYGVSQPIGETELYSLNAILNAFKHDFSFIEIGRDRISFGGDGNDMYVFSINGQSPKWFYAPDDGVNFSTGKLSGNWYFLYNNVR